MRAVPITILISALSLAAVAADQLEPLDVKTGLWNVTFTTNVSGAPPIPADRLEQMTPEMRARLEQRWKDREAKGAQTKTKQTCITDTKLKEHAFIEDEPNCTRTVLKSSSKELNVRVQCTSDEGTSTSTYHIQAQSSDDVKGAVRIERSGHGKTLDITNDFTAKWAGSACGNVK